MACEPQASRADMAAGRAESAQQATQESKTMAQRRIVPKTQIREEEPRVGLRLRAD